jgi:murein endopeptidase
MYGSIAYCDELEDEVTRVYQPRSLQVASRVPRASTRRARARARARLGMVTTLIALVLSELYSDPPTIPTAFAKDTLRTHTAAAEVLLAPGADPLETALRRASLPSRSVRMTALGLDQETQGLSLRLVPFGGISVGEPQGGRLYGGIQLPKNPSLYIVRRPEYAYGSTHAVIHLQLALAKFRQHSKYQGPLIVSDLSGPRGGRHTPHISHQSGRDADVWLPLRCDRKGVTLKGGDAATAAIIDLARFSAARPQEIDWDASWQLVKALARTGQVEGIFLARTNHHFLRQAALRDGVSAKDADEIIQGEQRTLDAMVRHVRGHDKHLHVRFRCADYESYCR